ncbi:MAG: polysaccharide deacetylase family protein [Cyclobacteriaceae bacterium]|nr:polysaccharide deacetylase family protein [Cyclobacteriaceae bacterium]
MNLFRTPFFLPLLYPKLTWRIPASEKKVYLTFDDGPVPGPTEFVLDTLQKFRATATFFCIGDNVRKHPHIFQKVVQQGHRIGNHTFNHLKGWGASLQAYTENVRQCEEEIDQHLPGNPKLFRPPYGRITCSQINALKTKYKIIMWDVLTQDYRHSMAPDTCIRGTIQATRPGSVVVFHDSYKAERNLVFALPRYLEYLADEGYSFGRL